MRFLNIKGSHWKASERVVLRLGASHWLNLPQIWSTPHPHSRGSVGKFAKATRLARNAVDVNVSRPAHLAAHHLPSPSSSCKMSFSCCQQSMWMAQWRFTFYLCSLFPSQQLAPLQCPHCLEASPVYCVRRTRWPGGASLFAVVQLLSHIQLLWPYGL